ncbi:hypothetical protein HMPREF9530_04946 [Escherichia coli MS 21-1]|nr:hypothetical protein HMPREF9530_04946 [Escherichia coli MS 21-1]EGB80025.1 hypothetical protein HMPREF9533_05182 [Escherichia coli MS 60-1]
MSFFLLWQVSQTTLWREASASLIVRRSISSVIRRQGDVCRRG